MRQPWMQLVIQNMAMNMPGSNIPSPLVSIALENAESGLQTNFTAVLHVYGDERTKVHVGSFEMMLYEFAQMKGDSNLPAYIEIGWSDEEKLTLQAMFIKFQAAVKTNYMEYTLTGIGSFSNPANIEGIAFPAVKGNFQPSKVLEACLDYVQANDAFDYDIDHDDEVVPINRPAMITSIGGLVYGNSIKGGGDYQGLIQQSYCDGSRSSAYRLPGLSSGAYRSAGFSNAQIFRLMHEPVSTTQRSASAYTFSMVSPTFHQRGVIRYKNNSNLTNYTNKEALIWGGKDTNILSITATYNGVTQQLLGTGSAVQTGLGIGLDGELITSSSNRQNSYAASASSMYAAGNVVNNLNAISTQFNTDIKVTIVGNPKVYEVNEAIRVIVYSGGTLNPITGTYRILKVAHNITGTAYTTTLTLKRLDMITANDTVAIVSGYQNGAKVNGVARASYSHTNLNFGKPFQNLMTLMRRGSL